jgi:hypothetical protein
MNTTVVAAEAGTNSGENAATITAVLGQAETTGIADAATPARGATETETDDAETIETTIADRDEGDVTVRHRINE